MESDREEGEVSDVPPADSTTRDNISGEEDDTEAKAATKPEQKRIKKEEKRRKKLEKQRLLEEEEAAAKAERKKKRRQEKEERRQKKKQMREAQAAQEQEQIQAQQTSTLKLGNSSTKSVQKAFPIDLVSEKKKARDFIKQWASNGLTYQQLLEEGLDSHFLRNIYQELNLDTTDITGSTTNKLSAEKTLGQHLPVAAPEKPEKRTALVHREKTLLATNPTGDVAQNSISVLPPIAMDIDNAVKIGPPPFPVIAPKPAQSTIAQAQAVAANNRREYIARLLAARAKNSTAPDASVSSPPVEIVAATTIITASISNPDILEHTNDPTQTNIEPVLAQDSGNEVTKTAKTDAPDVSLQNVTSLEERTQALKRKAQTELARLRLQALATAKAAKEMKTSPLTGAEPTTQPPVVGLTSGGPGRRIFSRPDSIPVINMLESGSEDGELLEETAPVDQTDLLDSTSTSAIPEGLNDVVNVASSLPAVPMLQSRSAVSLGLTEIAPVVNLPPTLLPLLSGQTTPNYQAKKRPVASDFDDDGPPTKFAKRPFGEVPGVVDYQDMVIEVSDDDSNIEHTPRPSLHRLGSRNGGPVNGFDSDQTGGVDADVASADEAERLRLREEQISEMKRRIMELEVKRRAKAALASRPGTPSMLQSSERSSPTMTPRLATKTSNDVDSAAVVPKGLATLSAPVQYEHAHESTIATKPTTPSDDAAEPTASTNGTISVESDTLSTVTTDARSILSTQHVKRHEEIRNRLPLINANFASTQAKMALLRAQMEALQAEMLQEQSEKESLVQELEAYGVDTEGMPHAELQAVKDSIVAQEAADGVDMEPQLKVSMDAASESENDSRAVANHVQRDTLSNIITPDTTTHATTASTRLETDTASILPPSARIMSAESAASDNMSLDDDESESGKIISMPIESHLTNTTASNFEQFETEQNADTRPTSASVSVNGALPKEVSSMRQSLTPVPAAEDTTSVPIVDDLEMELDSESDYEPPDAKPVVPANIPSARAQQQLTDISSQTPHTNDLASQPQSADFVASQDEPTVRPLTSALYMLISHQSSIVPAAPSFFKPYVSPLTNFKAYRYSPHYTKEVPGGLRSTTFSHAIDVSKPLCQYETLGGICNDPQCQDQHWRQIVAGGMYWFRMTLLDYVYRLTINFPSRF